MRVLKNNLLIQFSVVSFLIMAAVAMVINTVLADRIRSNAVDDLIDEAVGTSLPRVLTVLTPEDLDVPMTGARYDKFHEFVQRSLVSDRTARIKLWVKNGTVIYSNDRGAVGERYPSEVNLSRALGGENANEIKIPEDPENERERHLGTLMEVYTPFIFPGATQPQGALEIYQYYGPTARRIDSLRRWTLGSIRVGFGVLYASLLLFLVVGQKHQSVPGRGIDPEFGHVPVSSGELSALSLRLSSPLDRLP